MAINAEQQDFILEYISNGFNAIQAYLSAYPTSSLKTANTNAYRLLGKDEIKQEIERQVKEMCDAKYIKAERVLMELADIAFALKGDEVYDVKAKLKALELLQKQMGLQTTNSKIEATFEPVIFEGEDTLED